RVDRPTPPLQNYINGLRSKEGKVRLRRGARDTAESTMIENARHGPGYAQYEFVSGDDLCALSDAPFTACRRRLSRRTANPSPLALPSPAKSAASSRPPASLCRPICTST